MMVLVTSIERDEYGITIDLATEKKSATVRQSSAGYVQVICRNAANRVWSGGGKVFYGANAWDDATAAYKSSDMKAMIEAARQEIESGMVAAG